MASSKATASPSNTVIFARCHFVWAKINFPWESLTQHAKDVRWLHSWNVTSTLHFNHVSRSFSQIELLPCTLFCPCCTTGGKACLWISCHCCHSSRDVLPMLVEVWWVSFQMTSLRAAQIYQRSKVTRPAMCWLSEQHMSKIKYVKLLSNPTCLCSTVECPAQYQLSRATVQPTKTCQSSSTTVSHRGYITSLCTYRDCSRRRVRTHLPQILRMMVSDITIIIK